MKQEKIDLCKYEFKKAQETLKASDIKEEKESANKKDLFSNNDGFTLLELVMTIILIGIMSVGLYQVIIFGINDYMMNEEALHNTNTLSYASAVIRRNLEEAAMPPTSQHKYTITGGTCPLNSANYPSSTVGPVAPACSDGSAPISGSCSVCSNGLSSCLPSEIAFYKYFTQQSKELIVFCVNVNSNILYKQVTTENGTTTAYPISDNISDIVF
ncbi:MAG: type II secretion system protein [bacterium]